MAATGSAPTRITLDSAAATGTDDLLTALLRAHPRISDLIFSPGLGLEVQINGIFANVESPALHSLSADDTRRIASHLIGDNKAAVAMLREQGCCDVSYALPGIARFRVNIFIQRGSCAIVMRVIPTVVPDLAKLCAPDDLKEVAGLRNGLVLVTGPRGSGKSSTLAAIVDHINANTACHIITIEDPIEFLHSHKRAIVHQRELHSDTPGITQAVGAALRQSPNVIVVGELKERAAIELSLEAAETGHLVLSTMPTLTTTKAIERLVAAFPASEQTAAGERLKRMLRYVVCQRLVYRNDGERTALFEIVGHPFPGLCSTGEKGAARRRRHPGIDQQLETLLKSGHISRATALMHAVDPESFSAKVSPSTPSSLR